jgi:hypothetical protein
MHGRFRKPPGVHHHSLSSCHKKLYKNYMQARNRIILVTIDVDHMHKFPDSCPSTNAGMVSPFLVFGAMVVLSDRSIGFR